MIKQRVIRGDAVKRFSLVVVIIALGVGQLASVDDAYHANRKPPTDGRVGANNTPDNAINQVQFWHNFRPEVGEKKLAAATCPNES
jgi:hypothetical protein